MDSNSKSGSMLVDLLILGLNGVIGLHSTSLHSHSNETALICIL